MLLLCFAFFLSTYIERFFIFAVLPLYICVLPSTFVVNSFIQLPSFRSICFTGLFEIMNIQYIIIVNFELSFSTFRNPLVLNKGTALLQHENYCAVSQNIFCFIYVNIVYRTTLYISSGDIFHSRFDSSIVALVIFSLPTIAVRYVS